MDALETRIWHDVDVSCISGVLLQQPKTERKEREIYTNDSMKAETPYRRRAVLITCPWRYSQLVRRPNRPVWCYFRTGQPRQMTDCYMPWADIQWHIINIEQTKIMLSVYKKWDRAVFCRLPASPMITCSLNRNSCVLSVYNNFPQNHKSSTTVTVIRWHLYSAAYLLKYWTPALIRTKWHRIRQSPQCSENKHCDLATGV